MADKKINLKKLRYAGLTRDEYNIIEHLIFRNCRHSLQTGSLVGTLLLFILSATSFLVPSLSKNRLLYSVTLIAILAVFICTRFELKKHPRWTMILTYAFLSIVFIFGIILGVPLSKSATAVTLCVMLFALPLLISDRPFRIDIYLTIVTVVFCICTKIVKPANISSVDLTNAISFLFLSIVVNYHVTKSKYNGLLMRTYIEKERDTDELTHLMTKAAFKRDVIEFMENENKPAALLVIDIDNFKNVNDTMGHAYGDAVLRIMGECIRETFEKPCLLGRFGGDEFVILLPERTDNEQVTKEVEKLIGIMEKKLTSSDNIFSVTGSIGIALMDKSAKSFDIHFKRADEALYESKKKGKNCYTFYLDGKMLSE